MTTTGYVYGKYVGDVSWSTTLTTDTCEVDRGKTPLDGNRLLAGEPNPPSSNGYLLIKSSLLQKFLVETPTQIRGLRDGMGTSSSTGSNWTLSEEQLRSGQDVGREEIAG